jgi:hypothetical protein
MGRSSRRLGNAAASVIAITAIAASGCAGTLPPSSHVPGAASPSVPTSIAPSATPPSPIAVGDPVTRVALSGQAPAALAVDEDRMWVYEIESGDLSLVDLRAGRETRSIHFGGLGSHVVLGGTGTIYVARFDTGGSGDHLVVIEPDSGTIGGVATGPLGALAVGEDGSLLALEKADRLLRVDPATRAIVGHMSVDIDDEHMEVVTAAGSAWVASDHTRVRRVAVPSLTVEATIDAGGGIPFVARGGVVWGARPNAIWAIDPATNAVSRIVALENVIEILAMDIDGDEAWIAVRRPGHVGAVIRVNLGNGGIVGEYPVSLPSAVRISGDRVWVASYLTNEILGFAR